MDPYIFFALVAFIIICVIPVVIGILWLMGHHPASLYDSFQKRSLFIKIPTTIAVVLIFSYAGILIISAIFTQYQDHADQVTNSKMQHYNNLITSAQTSIDIEAPTYALKSLDQAIAFMPDESRAYEMKADVLYDQNNYDDALPVVIKGISLDNDPSYLHPYFLQSSILHMLGRYGQAADSLQKATQYDPSDYDLYEYLAQEQNLAGQYDQALASINVYLGHTKDSLAAYVDRGISYYWLKQCQESMASFQHALDMLPKDEYFADQLSSSTLQLYDDVMHDADKKYAQSGSCIDVVE